ncbi:serine/threonine protein kinase [Halotia branconii]|uniref:non-specific serine/threonine protein kinase n=1 Tax=Halotia branconii CENA392 TaxID=1539056 RepID=A0AAJ6NR09_9CYAN|nr:serine/threonine-protein kinase [Halotia branconii]WGV25007.1 serine/threonine-protein kinase [Halotia branconii CENA392]
MSHITQSAVHCINPDCQRPYPQPWGNKFCNSCGAVLQLLDRYIPIQPLGSGGFAQIYTVWDQKTQTQKVLKVLVDNSPKALELFAQEAAVLINLRHPGVPKVDADGYFQVNLISPKPRQLPCLVMEKINGQTLQEILENYPQGCPEELVLSWFTQAVKILQELHKRQIIHRDIKPSNLMLRTPSPNVPTVNQGGTGWEQLVLIDFGGAKQFNTAMLRRESSSTRLFSSGYSPPEQVVGGNVGPAVDFYALGRTMIELLTGKYPPNLEDPQSGKLRWRTRVNVNRDLADLLDEMVQEDVKSRPANAAIILKRLAKITTGGSQPGLFAQIQDSVRQVLTQTSSQLTLLTQTFDQVLASFSQAVGTTVFLIAKTVIKILQACLATIWAMLLTGMGAGTGAIAGWILGRNTILGDRVAEYIFHQIPELFPNAQTAVGTQIIMFAAAGLGTALGLTISGCFGQRRRFLIASLMGLISYAFGWLFLQLIMSAESSGGVVGVVLVAVFLFTLSLGFRSHHIVYAVITAIGTASILTSLTILFPNTGWQFSSQSLSSGLLVPIAFFSFVGVLISFWLGVSYYLIVPGLRFLGWR